MQALAARVGILVPMPVARTLYLKVHQNDGLIKVNVGAAQTKGLVLAQPERKPN